MKSLLKQSLMSLVKDTESNHFISLFLPDNERKVFIHVSEEDAERIMEDEGIEAIHFSTEVTHRSQRVVGLPLNGRTKYDYHRDIAGTSKDH